MTTSAAIVAGLDAPWTVRFATGSVGVVLVVAALVDAHEFRIPNRLLVLAACAAAAGAWCAGGAAPRALVGALVAGGAMLLAHLGRGVGMGDVKMAAVVGGSCATLVLIAAPTAVAVSAFAAAAVGAMTGRTRLALGPALWFGWAISVASVVAGVWT
jgi:leader peptidase (prepilin peptidase)/N-methyltransferase